MADPQESSVRYSWHGVESRNEGGDTDHAVQGRTQRTDSTGGADPGGQDKGRDASGSFSHGQQQPTGLKMLKEIPPGNDCEVRLKLQRVGKPISQVVVPIRLTVPEWIHMGRSNSIQHRLIELLKRDNIKIVNFDTAMTVDLSAEIWEDFHEYMKDIKLKRIHSAFTEMKGKLETQCYEVPECLHISDLHQLQICKANQSHEGTYWKSGGGHFVFVADVGCKERVFEEFSSILCSLASTKEEVGEAASNNNGKNCTMEEMNSYDNSPQKALVDNTAGKVGVKNDVQHKESVTLSSEMNHFLSNNTAAKQYIIQRLLEYGIACDFDDKEECITVTLTSQDQRLKGVLQNYLLRFLTQKVKNLQGKKILEVYNVEELQKKLHQYHKSYEGKLVVLPHKQNQELILLGTDDAVTSAESYILFLVDEFANAEKRVLQLRDTDAKPNTSEIEKISENLTTGHVKVTVDQNEAFIMKVFGKSCSIDEFCQILQKMYDFSFCFTSPIMEPQLSLLREKKAAEMYLKKEAGKIGLKFQVDTKEKRYVVESQGISESDSKKFLSEWHKTHTYPLDHSLREETTENIRSYFRKSFDDSKVILKLDGDAVTIVATADVIASAIQCLKDWQMKNQSQIQQEDYEKVEAASSAPTESSPCSSKSDEANPTSQESDLASQVATGEETDHIFVKKNDKNILKCRLRWPLTKYCREITDCKNYVKDEFKRQGFEIQINKACDVAKVTLERSEDASIAKDLLTCFGAQVKSLENKSPTATDVRRMLKEKSSEAEKIVIYLGTGNKTLVLFGIKKLVDSVFYTLEDILDDFIEEDFCVTLTDEEHEQMSKGTLKEIEKEFAHGKIKISQKSGMLQVSGAKFVLEECRLALLGRLSKIQSAMKRDGGIRKISVTLSKHVMHLLKKKEIMDEIWEKFNQKGLSISLEGKVCFGALSFAALTDAEHLLMNLIIEKKYALRHEPIFQFMSGEQICEILTEKHGGKLTVCIDERHDLHIACPSEVWATVRNDFNTLRDQFITEDIDISEKKLGEKRSSEYLTAQLFELDIKLMGKAKIYVEVGTLMIVTTRDRLHYVKKKVDQLLLRIETESEINKQNPNVCVKLSALKLKLLEQPGVLDYINQKVRKKHLQMTFDIGKSCITVYGLSNEFADAGKDLIESCFETRTYALLKYDDLDPYQLEEFESLISAEESVHSGRIVTELNTQKGTITFVCTDDVCQAVEKMVTENLRRSCQCAKLTYRREVITYIQRFCSQKLQAVETNGVSIHTSFDGENGSFEITGQKQEIQKAKQKIKELCADVSTETFVLDSDNYFNILETDQGHHAVQNTEENTKSVISLRMPGSFRQAENESALPVEESGAVCEKLVTRPTVGIDKRELLTLNTDVIAVAYAEDRLPKMVYDSLTHAGVISQWDKNSSVTSQKAGGNKNQQGSSVYFGDKKLFKSKHIAFCRLPSWDQAGNDKEKQKVRNTICFLLQECINRSASEVVIVIAVTKLALFKRLAKQIIYQAKESLKTLTLKVSLLCADDSVKDLNDIMQAAESDTTSPSMSTSIIKNIFKSSKKTTAPKGPAKVNSPKAILVEVGTLENQKVDVIVSSSNCLLDLTKGGAAKKLNEATNGELQKDCASLYPRGIKFGEVAITGSHGLPCKTVFHGALTPLYKNENENLTQEKKQSKLQLMTIFIQRCLKDASNRKYESIAFPALGTGNLNYPVDEVAAVMFRAVEEYFTLYPHSTVKKVVFVLHEKDYDVIQIFKTEWLAHLYQRNVTGTPYPAKEERFHYQKIMIQVIEADDCKPGAGADEILCFWREEQLSDFKLHPYLGSHASSLQWGVYGPELREKKVKIMPGGTFFPSKTIVNMVIDDSQANQEELFIKAMTMAANSRCYVLQIPLLTAGDQQYLHVLANCLFKCISDELNGVLCVINILADNRNYSTLVQMFQDRLSNQTEEKNEASAQKENIFTMLYHTAAGWVKDKYSYFTSSSIGAEKERNRAALVIAAGSDSVCKEAYSSILKKVKMISSTQPASNESDFASGDYEDSAGYVHLTNAVPGTHGERKPFINSICKAEINPSYLRKENWSSLENEMKRKYGVEIKDETGTTYISGKFEDLFQARQFLSEVEGYPEVTAVEAEINRETTRKYTGDSHTLSEDQLKAAQHLIGESTFHECCDVEMFPPGNAKLHFVDRGELSSAVQQRILGVIQEEMIINAADRDKAGDVSKDAMKGFNDVYIKYQPDRNTMILFAEDWDKMARAKKRVLLQFGQSKVSSRGGRRFAGSKGADANSSGKMSFDKHTGCAKGRNIKVCVYKADITELKVDVIVNAANGHLSHGAGVARAIADAAGPDMTRESMKYHKERGQIKVSHLAVTGAGRLPYKMVFHAVGPEWYNYTDKHQCLEDLCCTILRCLCEAEKQRIATIAIPSISSAIFRVPKEQCARMYVRALKSFDQVVDNGSLGEVHFIDVSDKMVSLIQEELQNSWCKPGEEDDQKRDSDFINDCLRSDNSSTAYKPSAKQLHEVQQDDKAKSAGRSLSPPGPNVLPPGFFKFSDDVSLNIFKRDIFEMETDVFVSWEVAGLYSCRPLTKALIHKGGDDYQAERRKHLTAKKGDIVQTSPGKLNQSCILHAVVGDFPQLEEFSSTLGNVLRMCVEKKCTKVMLPVFGQISKVSGNSENALFIEAVVDALMDMTSQKNKPSSLHVFIVDNKQDVVDKLIGLLNQYPISTGLVQEAQASMEKDAKSTQGSDKDCACPICLEPLTVPSKLKCGHAFCKGCIDRAFKEKKVCPICKVVCGTITGIMPPGEMSDKVQQYSLSGYEGYNTIHITYKFKDGKQTAEHPHPGQSYTGCTRYAYLPDTLKGRKVLALLKVAWKRRLTFTVGTSVTMGGRDRVTWNEIHHKTHTQGGPTSHGYPDPEYLQRVQEELAAQGVTEQDLGSSV